VVSGGLLRPGTVGRAKCFGTPNYYRGTQLDEPIPAGFRDLDRGRLFPNAAVMWGAVAREPPVGMFSGANCLFVCWREGDFATGKQGSSSFGQTNFRIRRDSGAIRLNLYNRWQTQVGLPIKTWSVCR